MKPGATVPPEPPHGAVAGGAGFARAALAACFVGVFFYVWLRLDPRAEYCGQGVVFFLNRDFLQRHLAYPGGLADYTAAWLAQLNAAPWLAALGFTILALVLFLAAYRLCASALSSARTARLPVCLLPVFVLLAWRGRFDGHSLAAGVQLAVALGSAMICQALSRRPPGVRWLLAWLALGAVCYTAGWWGFLLALWLAGWCEARIGRRWIGLPLVVGPPLIVALVWAGLPPTAKLLNPWGPGLPLWFALGAFLVVPVGLAALACLPAAGSVAEPAPVPARSRPGKGRSIPSPVGSTVGRPWAEASLLVVILAAGWMFVGASFDGELHRVRRIEALAQAGQYEQLLALAAGAKSLPPAVEVRVHQALYHTGGLAQDLLVWAARGHGLLLPGMEAGESAWLPQAHTLLQLGQVNDAEHLAQEALEFKGDRPETLRLLADINVLKDRPRAAAVFLRLLAEVPLQRSWAMARLAALEQNPRLLGDPEMDLCRSRLVTTDLPHDRLPAENLLLQALDSNPRNQMAFEYLMAYYLLAGDLTRLSRHARKLQEFSYLAVPRHLEEAILLGQKLQGIETDLGSLKIRSETIQRFQSFQRALPPGAPSLGGVASLAGEYGDTFWLYYYSIQARAAAKAR